MRQDRPVTPQRHKISLAVSLTVACFAAATTAIGAAHAAQPQLEASEQRHYTIDAGPLEQQLRQFAEQSGAAVAVDDALLSGKTGPALQGSFSRRQAVNTLLANSGVQAIPLSEGGFRLAAVGKDHRGHDAAQDEAQASMLPPVTVTGEKIDRSLQNTTTAVTVLKGADLDQGDNRSVYNVVNQAPNVTHNGAGIPNIRGVSGTGPATGVFSFISGARPRVGTTIDGVAQSWSGQRYVDAGLFDVDQVEVLRGPQSTTQGRNTIGGAIVVNTRDPAFAWEGAVRAGYENQDGKALLATVVSGPLIDNELAFRIAAEGLRGNGFIEYPGTWPWNPSEVRTQNVRAKLLWKPSALPGLTAKLTVSNQENRGEYLKTVDSANPFDYQFTGTASNTRRQASSNNTVTADVSYQLSASLSTHLLVSRSDYNATFQESGANRFSLDLGEQSHTVEARLVYAPASKTAASGVLGVHYYDRKQNLNATPDGFVGDDKVKTQAVFGESNIPLTDSVDAIVGGRYERETQKRDVTAWPGKAWEAKIKTDIGDPLFLPKVGLSLKATPQTTLGLTARKGYSPGGGSVDWTTNQFYQYDKEEVKTYEFSTRSVLLDKRLSFNTNLFYNQHDGYQALIDRMFVNVPKGKSYGLEVEANARLARGLDVFGGIGLLHTEVTAADAKNPGIQGHQFNYAPKVTLAIGMKKQLASGFFFGGDIRHTGEYYSELENNDAFKAGGYTVVNAHVGYETSRYTLRAYARNLANAEVLYHRTATLAEVGEPRTVGVTFDYRF